MIRVSLIIPVKNEAQVLDKFISEILKLKTLPDELIFVDTGSIDNSIVIINSYSKKFKFHNIFYKILFLQNGFPGAARNFGVRSAKNFWIGFLDVGIYPDKNWLHELWKDLLLNNVSVIYGKCIFNSDQWFGKIICALSYGVNNHRPIVAASIFSKKIFEDFGYFDEMLRAGEDILWKNNIELAGVKSYVSETALVKYLDFPNSLVKIITKWFVYSKYESISNLTPITRKFIYLYIFMLLLLLFINYEAFFFLLIIYFLFRGIFDPIRRSKYTRWWDTTPQFLLTPFLALIIDFSSLSGYLFAKSKLIFFIK